MDKNIKQQQTTETIEERYGPDSSSKSPKGQLKP
jgi:hypothetical protein